MNSDYEHLITHNDREIFRDVTPEGREVVFRIIEILQGVYGVDGVYPLSEFSFCFMDEDFLIFDRNSVYITSVSADIFSEDDIDWILSHLNIFNPDSGSIEPDYPVVSFTVLRDGEYLVWRVPNSEPVLLGSILYNISSDIDSTLIFHPRKDNLIISKEELKEIDDFIKEVG